MIFYWSDRDVEEKYNLKKKTLSITKLYKIKISKIRFFRYYLYYKL